MQYLPVAAKLKYQSLLPCQRFCFVALLMLTFFLCCVVAVLLANNSLT